MSNSSTHARASKGVPPAELLTALMNPTRWKLLAEMATGEVFTVRELAKRVHDEESNISKHLATMRRAGITEFGPGRLHRLVAAYVPGQGTNQVDFGFMVIRLPSARSV
jgi:hypothetical protein